MVHAEVSEEHVQYLTLNGVPELLDQLMKGLLDAQPPKANVSDYLSTELRQLALPPAPKLIFLQIGLQHWASPSESVAFLPSRSSGKQQQALHASINSLPNTRCYSIWPSKLQTTEMLNDPMVRVLSVDHDVPFITSEEAAQAPIVSQAKLWSGLPQDKVEDFARRMADLASELVDALELEHDIPGCVCFAICHHAFLTPTVMARLNRSRQAAGKLPIPFGCIAYPNETGVIKGKGSVNVELPWTDEPEAFSNCNQLVRYCWSSSSAVRDGFRSRFPSFPWDRHSILPLVGGNEAALLTEVSLPSVVFKELTLLAGAAPASENYQNIFLHHSSLTEDDRTGAVISAAASYEKSISNVVTVVILPSLREGVPADPEEAALVASYQKKASEAGLRHFYFTRIEGIEARSRLYNSAMATLVARNRWEDVEALSPLLDSLAVGTPVIAVGSVEIRQLLAENTGRAILDSENVDTVGVSLATAASDAVREKWKSRFRSHCIQQAARFSVASQAKSILKSAGPAVGYRLI